MNRSEWERKVIDESYKLDQYLKKSPPVLSEELKQTYTKLLDECEKALRRFEIEISAHPFGGNSFLKSLCEGIEKLILKIKDYLYLYKNWKPTPPVAPVTPPTPPAPPTPTAPVTPPTPPAANPIVPPPVTPADTSTKAGGNTNTQAGGNTNTQAGGSTNTQDGQSNLAPTTPSVNNEEEPKGGFFTPTNILLMLLVVGGGIFFMTRKGK